VITSTDGLISVVSAESLSNCISVNKELTLASGQSIVTEKMRAFEFTPGNVKPILIIISLTARLFRALWRWGAIVPAPMTWDDSVCRLKK
jgi:hypothetical protein